MKTVMLSAMILAGCSQRKFVFRDGDLLFQVSRSSEMTDAITDATGSGAAIKFTHVAMIECCGNKQFVIEATSNGGVRRITLEEFLKESECDTDGRPLVAVYRLRGAYRGKNAVARAKSFLGQPYDYAFLPGNGAMYCSELIYESYLDEEGRHIFTARPMTFKGESGEYDRFWIDLFDSLSMDIPEGVDGTNPQQMSQESSIEEVYRYF